MPVQTRGFPKSSSSKKCAGMYPTTSGSSPQEETKKMDIRRKVKINKTKDIEKVPHSVLKDSNRMTKFTRLSQRNESGAMPKGQGNADDMPLSSTKADSLRTFRFYRDRNNGNDTVGEYKNVSSKQSLRKTRIGNKSNEEIFNCYECEEEFAVKGLLTQHLQVHFGTEVFQGGAQCAMFGERAELEGEYCNPPSPAEDSVDIPNNTEKTQETLKEGEKSDGSLLLQIDSKTCANSNCGLNETVHEERNGSEEYENIHLQSEKGKITQNMSVAESLKGVQSGQRCRRKTRNKENSSKRNLEEDVRIQSGKSYTCNVCKKEFPDQKHLRSHISMVHLKKNCTLSEFCIRNDPEKLVTEKGIHENRVTRSMVSTLQMQTSKETDNNEHIKTTSTFNSDYSPRMPSDSIPGVPDTEQRSSSSVESCVRSGIPLKQGMDLDKPYSCNVCLKSFKCKRYLSEHLSVHSEKRPHSCSVCLKSFKTKKNLIGHMEIHSSQRNYSCTTCSKRFNWKSNLKRHMLLHSGKKPHTCSVCLKRFIQKSTLKDHMLTHLGVKSYCCTLCSQRFIWESHLKRHLLTHTGKKPHSCTVCSKGFTSKYNLNCHMLMHSEENQHSCNICSRGFTRKDDLKTHMLIHSDRKPHPCSVCMKRFRKKSHLSAHMLIHSSEKHYSCSDCLKKFTKKDTLKTHMLTHSGEKHHSCSICSKRFTHKSTLIRHMLTHSGEKPYACRVCSKRFTQKSHLKTHTLTHSG